MDTSLLETNLLTHIKSLDCINLSSNSLVNIDPGALPSVNRIYLSNNKLQNVPELTFFRNKTELTFDKSIHCGMYHLVCYLFWIESNPHIRDGVMATLLMVGPNKFCLKECTYGYIRGLVLPHLHDQK